MGCAAEDGCCTNSNISAPERFARMGTGGGEDVAVLTQEGDMCLKNFRVLARLDKVILDQANAPQSLGLSKPERPLI